MQLTKNTGDLCVDRVLQEECTRGTRGCSAERPTPGELRFHRSVCLHGAIRALGPFRRRSALVATARATSCTRTTQMGCSYAGSAARPSGRWSSRRSVVTSAVKVRWPDVSTTLRRGDCLWQDPGFDRALGLRAKRSATEGSRTQDDDDKARFFALAVTYALKLEGMPTRHHTQEQQILSVRIPMENRTKHPAPRAPFLEPHVVGRAAIFSSQCVLSSYSESESLGVGRRRMRFWDTLIRAGRVDSMNSVSAVTKRSGASQCE